MREIIYDVAVSLDGFIAGPGGEVSAFPHSGTHVDAYLERIGAYGTVLMGRSTYEFGYGFGLAPGDRAYPHMDHHIFSKTLELPPDSHVNVVRAGWRSAIERLQKQPGAPIYLCGGGLFAGWALEENLIDRLLLKTAPMTLGSGVRLFEGTALTQAWRHVRSQPYGNGVVLAQYERVAGVP